MTIYSKYISIVLSLLLVITGISLLNASAKDTAYIQPEKFIYGDVDLDGKVTVKDATVVQKDLAKITYATAVQKYLADPEGTGYSVKNATAIQKYLAKYEVSLLFGTELVMASKDETWIEDISNSDFADDCIFVCVKQGYGNDYSIADFPEYNFRSLKNLNEKFNPDATNTYVLYLSEPAKENVIEALLALDYRTSLDLEYISINDMHFMNLL